MKMKLFQVLTNLLNKFKSKQTKSVLNGKQINLTGDNTTITSNNFKVDAQGNMTCNSANITGGKVNVSGEESGRETIRINNINNPSEYTSLLPLGLYSESSEGSVDIYCAGSVSGQSGISLRDQYGFMHISPYYIKSQYLYDNQTTSMAPNLRIDSAGEFKRSTNTSSKRYKTEIKNIESAELDAHKLYNLPVRQFKYKTDYFKNTKDARYNKELIGFIAEEVAEIYPIATDYEIDSDGNNIIENWNERYIIPAMLKLIQEQHEEIEQLKQEIEKLKKGEK